MQTSVYAGPRRALIGHGVWRERWIHRIAPASASRRLQQASPSSRELIIVVSDSCILPTILDHQIFQSGTAASAFLFPPERRSSDWTNFVSAVSDCADAQPNDSFSCLRRANVTSLVAATAVAYAKSSEQFPFQPAIDGPGGVLPDLPSKLWDRGRFAKIPFLAGTCEDEGYFAHLRV